MRRREKMLYRSLLALACALVGSAAYTVVPDTAINLVGDSSDAANRMEMRKAEMAKVQEQHQAEREKMKAQKEAAREAEKERKQLQKTGSVTPSPAPEEKEEKEEKEDKAEPAFDSKHSAEWNKKHNSEMKLASKHSDEWNAKHVTEKEASPSATSSKKEVKETSSSDEDGIQDDGSGRRQVHSWEWRHRNEPCKTLPCKDSEKQESDH